MEKQLKQRPSNSVKIVLYGPESSGKTTLARALAEQYNTAWVPEYMRSYLQKKWDDTKEICSIDDLIPIAKGQIKLENETALSTEGLVFCDTNLRELKVYSQYYFNGFCPSEIRTAVKENTYALYFLTYIDTPWEADDLRDRPNDRSLLFRIFEEELITNKIDYVLLKGSLEQRLATASEHLTKLRNES